MLCIIIQPRFPMVPVRVFTRFSQTFDEVEMPTRSSVQEQHLREVVFRVEFVLHNRLFQRQFIFVDAICLLQAALSCLEYVFLQAALSCLEYVFLQAALSCLEYVSCNLGAVYYNFFAFFTYRFELLLSSDICAECDMWHYTCCVLVWWHHYLYISKDIICHLI